MLHCWGRAGYKIRPERIPGRQPINAEVARQRLANIRKCLPRTERFWRDARAKS